MDRDYQGGYGGGGGGYDGGFRRTAGRSMLRVSDFLLNVKSMAHIWNETILLMNVRACYGLWIYNGAMDAE